MDSTEARAEPSQGWRRVPMDELSDIQKKQLASAQSAVGEMAKQLMGRLQSALKEGGPPAGVQVCEEAAPRIASSVAEAHGVEMGRTSHKLRNPANEGPDWTDPIVEERVQEPVALAGPDGRLGMMSPIQTGEACLKCHGEPSQLAPGVAEALKENYPKDRATGFAEGDLRGWFWVEVPAPTS